MVWKGKTSSMQQSCGWKCLVDARGQRRMSWLIQADRRATLTEVTTRYNRGCSKAFVKSQHAQTLRQMGYYSRRPHRVPLISTTNRKRGYNLQELTKIGQLKTKNFCNIMSLQLLLINLDTCLWCERPGFKYTVCETPMCPWARHLTPSCSRGMWTLTYIAIVSRFG